MSVIVIAPIIEDFSTFSFFSTKGIANTNISNPKKLKVESATPFMMDLKSLLKTGSK